MRLVVCSVVGFGANRACDRVAAASALRGGNWNNGVKAGVFALNLNNAPSNSNVNIGFRLGNAATPELWLSTDGRAVPAALGSQSFLHHTVRKIHEQAEVGQ